MIFNKSKQRRQNERDFYAKTRDNQNAGRRGEGERVRRAKTKADPEWYYLAPTWAATIGVAILGTIGLQYFAMIFHNLPRSAEKLGFFNDFGMFPLFFLVLFVITPIVFFWVRRKTRAIWYNNNAVFLSDDMDEWTNDAYIRTMDHLTRELEIAPDAALGFDGHVSTIMGHAMISNKGIKKINVPEFDPDVPGQVKRDADGNIVYKKMPMFDEDLGNTLFQMSGVPHDKRTFYDARDYDFNPKLSKKQGGKKGERAGVYDRKPYDTVADFINNEFYVLDTETDRPAGVYFYDRRPVNTILIAITRGGKGQTYIEPAFDLWTREKHKWNIFTTDPKGELLAKFYYAATVRGMDVVQFNLMHPNLTNVFNPLANAIQEFRRDNPVKGTSVIDSIISTLFPDNGEIWNPAAGNMFRRAVYMLFDYYIEQEKYIRYIGHRDNVPQEIIDQEIDNNYSKVTLFNVYSLIGDLASKISKDVEFINIDPSAPVASEKDLLTLMFDAMAMLPTNILRSKAITANNSVKQVATAQQTVACIYATLLTGLSVYADDTAIALMSGSLSESFDIAGLGFPRRFGVNFDREYVKEFRITKELCRWTCYRDKDFTDKYEGDAYLHEETFAPSGWTWAYFAGIFDQEETFLRLDIVSGKTIARSFFFKFIKGYKKNEGISYIIDPITHKKIVSGGVLVELDPQTKEPHVSTFEIPQIDYMTRSYNTVSKPIITANQVYYNERPKFIFAITPPHLQVYQKHILIIIKQILDEQYSNSYVVKSSRKPIVGTRLMLEEAGNIRSGENGIPDLDTATSIALGQDVQITFVLQSFQQLRAVYGEDVEKIIRANSVNTIFLKSNDEELINELVRLSGVKHEIRNEGKSVTRKLGDLITVAEPVLNYSANMKETTALTSNDLLFLAGDSPGNSITFTSGEMPIVNTLANITPMAAGLHRRLPQASMDENGKKTKPYSDSTMPSTATGDSVNFLNNLIDGEALVRARVAQAKIAQEVKETILEIAAKHDVQINERDGELANIMMNIVYERFEREEGTSRTTLSSPVPYHQLATEMDRQISAIKDQSLSQADRMTNLSGLRENLIRCAMDKNLQELTAIYRDQHDDNLLGYDLPAISRFVMTMRREYPAPANLKVDIEDVFEVAGNTTMTEEGYRYTPYEIEENKDFDILNTYHIEAFGRMVEDIIDDHIREPQGLTVDASDDGFIVHVNNVKVADVRILRSQSTGEERFACEMVADKRERKRASEAIEASPALIQLLQGYISEVEAS